MAPIHEDEGQTFENKELEFIEQIHENIKMSSNKKDDFKE